MTPRQFEVETPAVKVSSPLRDRTLLDVLASNFRKLQGPKVSFKLSLFAFFLITAEELHTLTRIQIPEQSNEYYGCFYWNTLDYSTSWIWSKGAALMCRSASYFCWFQFRRCKSKRVVVCERSMFSPDSRSREERRCEVFQVPIRGLPGKGGVDTFLTVEFLIG